MEKRRPPAHIQKELDLEYQINRQSVEIRPFWRDPETILEEPVAKATYVQTRKVWKVYWQRADLINPARHAGQDGVKPYAANEGA